MSYDPYSALPEVPSFELTSTTLSDGDRMPLAQVSGVFGLGGEDRLPQLTWSGAPEGTKSYALTCFDPDAPTASGFWHLAVSNIPASVTSLEEGAIVADRLEGLPENTTVLRNDGGMRGFVGAAPPEGHGDHRYMFVVHALDVDGFDLDEASSPALLGFQMFTHTLGRARLTCVFGR